MQTLHPTLFKALLLLALSVAYSAWAADPKPASSDTSSAAACPAVLRHTVERLQDEIKEQTQLKEKLTIKVQKFQKFNKFLEHVNI